MLESQTVAELQAALDKIATPDKFIQGAFAVAFGFVPVDPRDESAICWCPIGALDAVGAGDAAKAALLAAVKARFKWASSVPHFTDAATTTHADILECFGRAISGQQEAAQFVGGK